MFALIELTMSWVDTAHVIVNVVAICLALSAILDIIHTYWLKERSPASLWWIVLVIAVSASSDGYVIPVGAILWLLLLRWVWRNRNGTSVTRRPPT